jgi:hypothetical protein
MKRFLVPIFLLTVFVATIWIAANKHAGSQFTNVVIWDTEGYYIYLPAVFIHHSFENISLKTKNLEDGTYYLQPYHGTQKIFTKYTCGVALLLIPFWLLAHLLATILPQQFPPDGFSEIYSISVVVAVAFYLTLGIFFTLLNLRKYFSEAVSVLTCLCLWLGTNLLQYSAFMPGCEHIYGFCLISIFIFLTPKFHLNCSCQNFFFMGLLYGMIVLLRPTNFVIILYLLFYGTATFQDFKNRIITILKRIPNWIVMSVGMFITFIPQLVYWHYISGKWILYSYGEEGFIYWKAPKMLYVLFHPQNGLFVYAPLLLLALIGLVITWNNKVYLTKVTALILILTLYFAGSWSCWWFGGAYGHRPFMDFFGLLAIPMAFVVSKIFDFKSSIRNVFLIAILFLVFASVRMNMIYAWPWEGANWGWKNVLEKYEQALYLEKLIQ